MAEVNNLSDEDPIRKCDPCRFGGVNKEAAALCQVCSGYLCDTCIENHRRLKATRDHELKPCDVSERRSIKQKSLIYSIMTCTVHDGETLSRFCLSHDAAICNRCSTIKHRRCTVKPMKEVVHDSNLRHEVEVFLVKIKSFSSAVIDLKDSRERDKLQIINCCIESKQEVVALKMEVIGWIEKLAKDMEDAICDIEKKFTTDFENDIKATNEMSKQIQETIDSFECLSNADEKAAFVLMTKEKHKLDEGIEAKDDILNGIKPVKFEFLKSDQLVTLMSKVTAMGVFKIDHPSLCDKQLSSEDNRVCFQQLTSFTRRDINIGSSRGVTGCAFMPDGRLVVCEGHGSNSVKVFSDDFIKQSEINIASVWDVAVVSENEVIVSQRNGRCLQLLNIAGVVVKGKTILVGKKCWGVDYKNDRIYVICNDNTGQGGTVMVLTITGDTVNTFNVSQGNPIYLAVNSAGDRIVVSTYLHNSVQCFDSIGATLYTHYDSQLSGSLGVMFDSYDNFMVCGEASNNLHAMESDGTKQNILLISKDGLDKPYCLAYRPSDQTLVIGQFSKSTPLLVFMIY